MEKALKIIESSYKLTFNTSPDYEWEAIAKIFEHSKKISNDLISKVLINQDEDIDQLNYWIDICFMEFIENDISININSFYYIENKKFLNKLPIVTAKLGREILIDSLIDNKASEEIFEDSLVEAIIKKKSRDDLRDDFINWNDETKKPSFVKSKFRFLVAACLVGVLATVGYFSFNNNQLDFNNSAFVSSKEINVFQDGGLGFTNSDNVSNITVQILDYNALLKRNKKIDENIHLNTYSFNKQKLKLILPNNDIDISLIQLETGQCYLKLIEGFFKINESKKFIELKKIENTETIAQLEQILFENE